jgi:hypothetical protein
MYETINLNDFESISSEVFNFIVSVYGFDECLSSERAHGLVYSKKYIKDDFSIEIIHDRREVYTEVRIHDREKYPSPRGKSLVRLLVESRLPVGNYLHKSNLGFRTILLDYAALLKQYWGTIYCEVG